MRFKVDENVHPDVSLLLRWAGHDALTVWDQGLRGKDDTRIAEVCRAERRALVTLGLDFADIRNYPPDLFSGIIVIRTARQSRQDIVRVFQRALALLPTEPLVGRLWIIEDAAVRMHGADDRLGDEPKP
jgi:predicted nuclease of predicted toxin-antitoxin system